MNDTSLLQNPCFSFNCILFINSIHQCVHLCGWCCTHHLQLSFLNLPGLIYCSFPLPERGKLLCLNSKCRIFYFKLLYYKHCVYNSTYSGHLLTLNNFELDSSNQEQFCKTRKPHNRHNRPLYVLSTDWCWGAIQGHVGIGKGVMSLLWKKGGLDQI